MSVMRLCFCVIIKILLANKSQGSNQECLVPDIFRALGHDRSTGYDSHRVSRYATGGEKLPLPVIEAAGKAKVEDVARRISESCMSFIDPNHLPEIVLSILKVLKQDETIKGSTIIGGRTKDEWLYQHTFEFEEFLAIFLIYAVSNIDNTSGTRSVNHLKSNPFKFKKKELTSIHIKKYCAPVSEEMILPLTIDENEFFQTFKDIEFLPTYMFSDMNDLRVFCLDIQNGVLSYEDLIDFLQDNLGAYVYSRNEIADFMSKHKGATVVNSARKQIIRTQHTDDALKQELSGMMVYSFLEGDKKAPKIFSYAEIDDPDSCNPEKLKDSYGLHLLKTHNEKGALQIKLIVNVACIEDRIESGIDSVFSTMLSFCTKGLNHSWLLQSNIFKARYSDDEIKAIRSIIIPTRGMREVDLAFGVFIGFSIDDIEFADGSEEYRESIYSEIREKVSRVIGMIGPYISGSDLKRYPIYLYFLPFTHAEKDSIDIMKRVLE